MWRASSIFTKKFEEKLSSTQRVLKFTRKHTVIKVDIDFNSTWRLQCWPDYYDVHLLEKHLLHRIFDIVEKTSW